MKYLFILNDPAYGTERSYNALRLALTLQKREGIELTIFLLADAVNCAKVGQKTPNGYYNFQNMFRRLTGGDTRIGACGTCMDARGFADTDLIEGIHKSTMDELTDWTIEADKVLVF